MGRYLRDEQLANHTIDADALSELGGVLAARAGVMPEYTSSPNSETPSVFLTYTIRFDEKGYRIFEVGQLLQYFSQATQVERVIFELTSADALTSSRLTGSYVDLKLDTHENAICFLTVSSDNEDWMNGTFAAIKEVLGKRKNRYWLIRNPWVEALLQVLGVFLGFIVSLWGASRIAPYLAVENAFLISFLLVLLLFSNLWTPINVGIKKGINKLFPTVRFYRPERDRLHWLLQAVIGGIVAAAVIYTLGIAFSYAGKLLGVFINDGG